MGKGDKTKHGSNHQGWRGMVCVGVGVCVCGSVQNEQGMLKVKGTSREKRSKDEDDGR